MSACAMSYLVVCAGAIAAGSVALADEPSVASLVAAFDERVTASQGDIADLYLECATTDSVGQTLFRRLIWRGGTWRQDNFHREKNKVTWDASSLGDGQSQLMWVPDVPDPLSLSVPEDPGPDRRTSALDLLAGMAGAPSWARSWPVVAGLSVVSGTEGLNGRDTYVIENPVEALEVPWWERAGKQQNIGLTLGGPLTCVIDVPQLPDGDWQLEDPATGAVLKCQGRWRASQALAGVLPCYILHDVAWEKARELDSAQSPVIQFLESGSGTRIYRSTGSQEEQWRWLGFARPDLVAYTPCWSGEFAYSDIDWPDLQREGPGGLLGLFLWPLTALDAAKCVVSRLGLAERIVVPFNDPYGVYRRKPSSYEQLWVISQVWLDKQSLLPVKVVWWSGGTALDPDRLYAWAENTVTLSAFQSLIPGYDVPYRVESTVTYPGQKPFTSTQQITAAQVNAGVDEALLDPQQFVPPTWDQGGGTANH